MATQENAQKIPELESMRGVAALIVVLFHIQPWNSNFLHWNFIRNGSFMVDLFFVLSGFVIYRAYGEQISSRAGFSQFIVRRWIRLYPVHFVFLLAFLAIELGKYFLLANASLESNRFAPFERNTPFAFLTHFMLIQSAFSENVVETFNGPSWSISVEMFMYLLMGIVVLFFRTYRIPVFALCVILGLVCVFLSNGDQFALMGRGLAGFSLGCIGAWWSSKMSCQWSGKWCLIPLAGLGFVLSVPAGFTSYLLVLILTMSLIMCIVHGSDGRVKSYLGNRAFSWLGKVSYSLYMSHTLVIYLVFQVLAKGALGQRSADLAHLLLPQKMVIWVDLGTLAIALVVSSLVYRWVEAPSRRLSQKFGKITLTRFVSSEEENTERVPA